MAFLDETGLAELWASIGDKYGVIFEHCWSYTPDPKYIASSKSETNYVLQSTSSDSAQVTWYYGSAYTFDENTGKYTITNAATITRGYSQHLNELIGKYCIQGSASGTTMFSNISSISQNYNGQYRFLASSCTVHEAVLETVPTSYYTSTDRNAYPDGNGYVYLGVPFDNAATGSKIATGSYTGTGTYGESNPNSLTFDFDPKIIFIFNRSEGFSGSNGIIWASDLTSSYTPRGYSYSSLDAQNDYKAKKENNTVSWYYNDAAQQMNTNRAKYGYLAIG